MLTNPRCFQVFCCNRSKAKAHSNSPRCSCRSKTIFIIYLIENIFDGAKKTQRHFFLLEPESITGCQIAFSIAFETVNIGAKGKPIRIEDRREIVARCKKIKIDPKPPEPLRRHECELMIGNAERFSDARALSLRYTLFAVGKCV